jgi:transcriptional regulator with XRE-family HTH domain
MTKPENDPPEVRGEYPDMGGRMRRIRESLDMTQTAFAVRIGTTAQNISNYENGMGVPWQAAVRIVTAFPWITTDYIYVGKISSPEMARHLGLLPEKPDNGR